MKAATGLSDYLRESGFDLDRKLDAIRGCRKCGRGPIPAPALGLVFVDAGAMKESRNNAVLMALDQHIHELEAGWLPCRLHAVGLRDGPLEDHHRGPGHAVGPIYVEAMMGVHVDGVSCATDLALTGTAQIAHDPSELTRSGLRPYEHYLPFDGTCQGLLSVVTAWRRRRAGLADMVERAYHAVKRLP